MSEIKFSKCQVDSGWRYVNSSWILDALWLDWLKANGDGSEPEEFEQQANDGHIVLHKHEKNDEPAEPVAIEKNDENAALQHDADSYNDGQATFLGTEVKKFKVTPNQSSSIKALRRRKTITKLRKKKKKTIRMSNKTNAHSFKRRVRKMKQSSCTHKPKGHSCNLFNANRIELYQFLRSIVDDNSTPEHVLHWLKELKNRDRHLLGRSNNVCSG